MRQRFITKQCQNDENGYVFKDTTKDTRINSPKNESRFKYLKDIFIDSFDFNNKPDLNNSEQHKEFESKYFRIYSFLSTPLYLEKFISYGFLHCYIIFLYTIFVLPIHFFKILFKLIYDKINGRTSYWFNDNLRILFVKGSLIFLGIFLIKYIDISMVYHVIRVQSIMKIYIIYNMLEVFDRLISSYGQDLYDSLFWVMSKKSSYKPKLFTTSTAYILTFVYVYIHIIIILFQATALHVAFNSNNKSLITVILSNNFVELKGSVFKKFEKNNLFQVSCSDVRERFHILVLIIVVCYRNVSEQNFTMDNTMELIFNIFLLYGSEFLVDWMKHGFITKFNDISPEVYNDYLLSLCRHMKENWQNTSKYVYMDQISRKFGFSPIPLSILLLRTIMNSFVVNLKYVSVTIIIALILIASYVLIGLITYKISLKIVIYNNLSNLETFTSRKSVKTTSKPIYYSQLDVHYKSVSGKSISFRDTSNIDDSSQLSLQQNEYNIKLKSSFIFDKQKQKTKLYRSKSIDFIHLYIDNETIQNKESNQAASPAVTNKLKPKIKIDEIDRYTMVANRIV